MKSFTLTEQQLNDIDVWQSTKLMSCSECVWDIFRNNEIPCCKCDVVKLTLNQQKQEQPSELVDLVLDIISIQEDINNKCEVSIDTMNLVTVKLHCLDVKWMNLLCRLLAKIN